MLYFLASYSTELGFLKSIYLRDFISFSLSFLLVLFLGKPFIHYLQKKKFGETIRQEQPQRYLRPSTSSWNSACSTSAQPYRLYIFQEPFTFN